MLRLVDFRRLPVGARRLGLASVTMVAMFVPAAAPSAMAASGGEYAAFAQCPLGTQGLSACLQVRVESGELTLGKLKVPLINTQVLQGGLIQTGFVEETALLTFVGAANGETLQRTPQLIPAGTVQCSKVQDTRWFDRRSHRWHDRGTGGWLERADHALCETIFEDGQAGLYVTAELASPAGAIGINEENGVEEHGTALSLSLKFRLENPLLGRECYIGSDASPIVLELTDGTAGPLKGKLGSVTIEDQGKLLIVSGTTFVNDTFVAPEATGCGYGGSLDSLINTQLGLPAAAGTNTATMVGTQEQIASQAVEEANELTPETPPSRPPGRHRR